MKKFLTNVSPSTLIAQILTGGLAYYLLLTDNGLHCSIAYFIQFAHTLALKQHLIVLGLLPIFIAVVIFGAAMLGSLLGRCLDETIVRFIKQKKAKTSFTSQI